MLYQLKGKIILSIYVTCKQNHNQSELRNRPTILHNINNTHNFSLCVCVCIVSYDYSIRLWSCNNLALPSLPLPLIPTLPSFTAYLSLPSLVISLLICLIQHHAFRYALSVAYIFCSLFFGSYLFSTNHLTSLIPLCFHIAAKQQYEQEYKIKCHLDFLFYCFKF